MVLFAMVMARYDSISKITVQTLRMHASYADAVPWRHRSRSAY